MSQVKKDGPNLQQGEGRAHSSKGNGSHTDPATDVKLQGPTGSPYTPLNPATKSNGSHLEPGPNLPGTDKTADTGGGTVRGHSRENTNAGKSKSGSKNAQHPNVRK